MKNIKVNSLKAGFSLVEMLVVIAIIGIIAAIAIPNLGSINNSARIATGQRNAQSVASIINAATAAGYQLGASKTPAELVNLAEAGISLTDGAFAGQTFSTGAIDNNEELLAGLYLTHSVATNSVTYNGNLPTAAQITTALEAAPVTD